MVSFFKLNTQPVKGASVALLVALTFACSQPTAEQQVAQAKQLIAKGDNQAATIELKNAVQQDPFNAEARFLLGQIYLQRHNYPSAEKEFNRALEYQYPSEKVLPLLSKTYQLSRDDFALEKLDLSQYQLSDDHQVEVGFYKLQALIRLEKLDEANLLLDEIINYQSDSVFKQLALVYRASLQQDFATATSLTNQILADNPDLADALKLRAQLHIQAGELEAAAQIYQRYVELNPHDIETAFITAKLLTDIGKSLEAEPIVDRLLQINDRHILLNQLKGIARFQAKDFPAALAHVEKAITENPQDPTLRLIAGFSAFQQQDYQRVVEHLTLIADQLPDNHDALRVLAQSHLKLGQIQQASDTFAGIDSISNKDASLLNSLGIVLASSGDVNKAKEIVQRSEAVSTSASELAKLGALQLSLNDSAGIVKLEQALEQAPDQQQTKIVLVNAYLRMQQTDKALNFTQKWISEDGNNPQAHLMHGAVLSHLKKFSEAEAAFNHVLSLEPDAISARLSLSDLYLVSDRQALAKQQLEKILQLDPVNIPALVKLFLIEQKSGNSEKFIAKLTQLATDHKTNKPLLLVLAKAHYSEQQYDQAITLLTANAELLQSETTYWETLGEAYLKTRQLVQAKTHYNQWLSNQPNNRKAVLGNLLLLDLTREWQEGVKVSTAFINNNDSDIGVVMLHTHFLLMTGKIDEARTSFETIPTTYAELPFYRGLKGQLLAANKQYKDALPHLHSSYQNLATSQLARLITFCYDQLQQGETSYQFLAQHVENHPTDVAAIMFLANKQLNIDTELAITSYLNALKANDKNMIAHNNLAYLFMQKGELEPALKHGLAAEALDPNNVNVLDTLGQIWLAKSQPEEAVKVLKRATDDTQVSEATYLFYVEALLLTNKQSLAKRKLEQRQFTDSASLEKVASLKKQFSL